MTSTTTHVIPLCAEDAAAKRALLESFARYWAGQQRSVH